MVNINTMDKLNNIKNKIVETFVAVHMSSFAKKYLLKNIEKNKNISNAISASFRYRFALPFCGITEPLEVDVGKYYLNLKNGGKCNG